MRIKSCGGLGNPRMHFVFLLTYAPTTHREEKREITREMSAESTPRSMLIVDEVTGK